MELRAVLTGSFRRPELRFAFRWGQMMPDNKKTAQDWVKALQGRRWDPSEKIWYITGTGINPDKALADAGIVVDYSEADGDLAGLNSLESLWRPLVKRSAKFSSTAMVLPRMAGFDRVSRLLGPGAVWDKTRQRFIVTLADLLDAEHNPKRGLIVDDEVIEAARQALQPPAIPKKVGAAARELAGSTGVDDDKPDVLNRRSQELIDVVASHTGYLPEWFGLNLFPFQAVGAYAIAGGQSFLVDAPGLGKTRQALAAAAISGAERIVIVCPPLVLTNWARESQTALGPWFAKKAHLTVVPPIAPRKRRKAKGAPKLKKADFPSYIAVMRPGRKLPELPDKGIVIVADSLLAARPQLLADIMSWSPDTGFVDESHRARTWSASRATAERNLMAAVTGLRIPMTGTPILANPVEMANQLAISGHLDPVFGGASKYINKFAKQNHFGAWQPRPEALPELQESLNNHCWVRRNKGDVLKQLPRKWRTVRNVDIDNRAFIEAHDALYETISDWVAETSPLGEPISEDTIKSFARESIGLMSPLRVAAGVSKVPAAIEIVTEWMENTTEIGADGKRIYTRPLVVWAHHKQVLQALKEAMPESLAGAAVIDGSTPAAKRQDLADQFQAGELGVLFCSIVAAGFGITLTRSSDVIFVEQDWTPSNISQAEDRVNRIGQTEQCMITTLFSEETLDPSVRAVLKHKAITLDAVMPGADNHVTKVSAVLNVESGEYGKATASDEDQINDVTTRSEIIERIVADVVASRTPVKAAKAA